MKILLLALFILFVPLIVCANENWISIEPMQPTQSKSKSTYLNPTTINPIRKIITNVVLVKKLMDTPATKEKQTPHKNWLSFEEPIK